MVKKSIASLEEALSTALKEIDELQERNQTNFNNMQTEHYRLSENVRRLETENRDYRKLADAAQEGRTHLLQDVARLSGMLDMLREMGVLPSREGVVMGEPTIHGNPNDYVERYKHPFGAAPVRR